MPKPTAIFPAATDCSNSSNASRSSSESPAASSWVYSSCSTRRALAAGARPAGCGPRRYGPRARTGERFRGRFDPSVVLEAGAVGLLVATLQCREQKGLHLLRGASEVSRPLDQRRVAIRGRRRGAGAGQDELTSGADHGQAALLVGGSRVVVQGTAKPVDAAAGADLVQPELSVQSQRLKQQGSGLRRTTCQGPRMRPTTTPRLL